MIKLYSRKSAERILEKYGEWIETVSRRYGVPSACVRAILHKEIKEIDLFDSLADSLVRLNWLRWRMRRFLFRKGLTGHDETKLTRGFLGKRDSSTGYGQIFGYVAIDAANYALDRGLDDAKGLKLPENRRPDKKNSSDLCAMWHRLARDNRFNIRMTALNLISAAEEMNGHTDFEQYTPEELQRAFTRYNANVKHITDYGREVYSFYLLHRAEEHMMLRQPSASGVTGGGEYGV